MANNTLSKNIQDTIDYLDSMKEALENQGQDMTNVPVSQYADKIAVYTTDADATANDILSPKTAYVNTNKITGAIIPTYKSSSFSLESTTLTIPTNCKDYRSDIGYTLALNSGAIEIYKINNDLSLTLVKTISSGWTYSLNDLKFGTTYIYQDESHCIYNIFASENAYLSRSYFWQGVYVIRFDLKTNDVYSGELMSTNLEYTDQFLNEWATGSNDTAKIQVAPINGTDVLLLEKYEGISANKNVPSSAKLVKTQATTYSVINVSQLSNARTSSGARAGIICDVSPDGFLYVTYNSNGNFSLYKLNSALSSCSTLINNASGNTYRPVLLNSKYIYNDKVYDDAGNILKEYSSSIFHNNANYKFYINGYILEIDTSSQSIYVYDFDNEIYTITYKQILSNSAPSSYSYTNTNIQYFPLSFDNRIITYNTNENKYLEIESEAGSQELISMNRNNKDYQYLNGSTVTQAQILKDYIAYNDNGKIIGTMTDNGALSYTPSISSQTIPAGYTSGGTVSGDANLISDNIKSGISIFGVSGNPAVVDTSDANAIASDILENQTAYVNGVKIIGTGSGGGSGTILNVGNKDVSVSGTTLIFDNVRNLLNYNNVLSTASSSGIYIANDTVLDSSPSGDSRAWGYSSANWQMSLPSGTYTLSLHFSKVCTNQYGGVRVYPSSGDYIAVAGVQNQSDITLTFTLSSASSIGILVKQFDGEYKVQLEEGSTATDWQPYRR